MVCQRSSEVRATGASSCALGGALLLPGKLTNYRQNWAVVNLPGPAVQHWERRPVGSQAARGKWLGCAPSVASWWRRSSPRSRRRIGSSTSSSSHEALQARVKQPRRTRNTLHPTDQPESLFHAADTAQEEVHAQAQALAVGQVEWLQDAGAWACPGGDGSGRQGHRCLPGRSACCRCCSWQVPRPEIGLAG